MKSYIILAVIVMIAILATVACAWLGEYVRARRHVGKSNWKRVATRATIAWILGGLAYLLAPFIAQRDLLAYGGNTRQFANIAEGRHDASITKFADAAITTRHLLYKQGSDVDHIAVAGATDLPMGTVADTVATADLATIPMTVDLLGKGSTKRMVSAAAISAGVPVYAAASGKIDVTGSVLVGISMAAAGGADEIIEVLDCEPTRIGYGPTGSGIGGAITQITSSATGVTLNKPCGQITTVALTTAAAAEERFTVTNSQVVATDVIALSTTYNGAGTPALAVVNVTAGAFDIVITNLHAANALNAVMILNFAVIKSVAA